MDVVIVGNNDLSQFSGFPQNSPEYQVMITKIHADVKRAGKIFGQANATYAKGHPLSNDAFFFQNGPSNDGWTPPGRRRPRQPQRSPARRALISSEGLLPGKLGL
jgi:hypothetical protein